MTFSEAFMWYCFIFGYSSEGKGFCLSGSEGFLFLRLERQRFFITLFKGKEINTLSSELIHMNIFIWLFYFQCLSDIHSLHGCTGTNVFLDDSLETTEERFSDIWICMCVMTRPYSHNSKLKMCLINCNFPSIPHKISLETLLLKSKVLQMFLKKFTSFNFDLANWSC